jgi:hypothetical protein
MPAQPAGCLQPGRIVFRGRRLESVGELWIELLGRRAGARTSARGAGGMSCALLKVPATETSTSLPAAGRCAAAAFAARTSSTLRSGKRKFCSSCARPIVSSLNCSCCAMADDHDIDAIAIAGHAPARRRTCVRPSAAMSAVTGRRPTSRSG